MPDIYGNSRRFHSILAKINLQPKGTCDLQGRPASLHLEDMQEFCPEEVTE